MAQIEAAMEGESGTNENTKGNGSENPTTEDSGRQVQAFNINSLQFTNVKSQDVYVSCIM